MSEFESIIGVEVHAELKTKTKIFCNCENTFGADPNTKCCPICLGYPGTLPSLNKKVVEIAILSGLALNCRINKQSSMDRKNYFYPDLPKGYQISQYDLPLCENGYLMVSDKKVRINRIHIEEDAGKLIHSSGKTLVDNNRCGVPLIEIVSEPDLRNPAETLEYLKNLRNILVYIGASDCKMNEGGFRVDLNVSVRKIGDEFGTRTEIKNLNSFQFVKKAIEFEVKRQIDIISSGKTVIQETRRFENGETIPMRSKENAADYRYFHDADIPEFYITDEKIREIESALPRLPIARMEYYIQKFKLPKFDAELLSQNKTVSDFFEETSKITKYPKILANLIISECFRLTDTYDPIILIDKAQFATVCDLFGDDEINSNTAKKLVNELWGNCFEVLKYVNENNLKQLNSEKEILNCVMQAINENAKIVDDFKNGKPSASNSLIGRVMAKTNGRGNPKIINKILKEELEKIKKA